MIKYKEEKYQNLLGLLQGFVGETACAETKEKFLQEFYRSWLYCSDEVIDSVYDMIKLLQSNSKGAPNRDKGRRVVGSIVLAMRKDIYGNTKKTAMDFLYIDVIQR